MRGEDPVARVSGICVALPEVAEKAFRGHTAPGFRVSGKFFVMVAEDRSSITFKAGPGVQEALVSGDPDRFFVAAYVGHKGCVGARLEAGQDWLEIAELIEDSYRMIAPKGLAAHLDNR